MVNDVVLDQMLRLHREELGKMAMQVVLYREALEEAGIEPPDRTGADLLDMWRATAGVMAACGELLHVYGTSKEMLLQNMGRVSPALERMTA